MAGKPISFLINTGATCSATPAYSRKTKVFQISVMGVDGLAPTPQITKPLPCTLQNTPFSHSFLVLPNRPTPILGKIVFHETDLWAQRGWGPLHYTVYLHKGVRNWGLGSVEEESNSWTVRTSQLGAGMEEVKRAPGTGVVPSLGSIRHV